jgi:O-6-methylguanine DNA methyltransferase
MPQNETAMLTFDIPALSSSGGARVTLGLEEQDGKLTAVRLIALRLGCTRDSDSAVTPGTMPTVIEQAGRQLAEYFARQRQRFDLPLAPEGTPFQRRVWDAVAQIPYGQTRSYWWVAVRMGDPYAFRAVGAANGANPLPIIIPCHRVIRHDGSLGGYSAGLDWKRFLLALEGAEDPHLTVGGG